MVQSVFKGGGKFYYQKRPFIIDLNFKKFLILLK
jgi:hypothetical protein